MTRRRFARAAALVVPLLLYGGWAGFVRFARDPMQSDTVIGRTEAQLRGSYGPPAADWPECQTLGLHVRPTPPTGPTRTLVFHPAGLFHPEGGTLWVWVVERDGQWVCFRSCWFADGVQF